MRGREIRIKRNSRIMKSVLIDVMYEYIKAALKPSLDCGVSVHCIKYLQGILLSSD